MLSPLVVETGSCDKNHVSSDDGKIATSHYCSCHDDITGGHNIHNAKTHQNSEDHHAHQGYVFVFPTKNLFSHLLYSSFLSFLQYRGSSGSSSQQTRTPSLSHSYVSVQFFSTFTNPATIVKQDLPVFKETHLIHPPTLYYRHDRGNEIIAPQYETVNTRSVNRRCHLRRNPHHRTYLQTEVPQTALSRRTEQQQ